MSSLTPEQKKIRREVLSRDETDTLIFNEIDDVDKKADQAIEIAKQTQKQEGPAGKTPIKGVDYDDGKDYVLTDSDKQEIADKIEVPVVEKIVEKTVIRETPIVTNEIKEVAVTDPAEKIAEKLNSLKGVIDVSVIKGAIQKKDLEDRDQKVLQGMARIDGRIKLIDQRWGGHGGGGLKAVAHDATLTGDGTAGSPLSVVGGSGVTSLNASGSPLLTGAITVSPGSGMVLTQVGQNIQISTTAISQTTADSLYIRLDGTSTTTASIPFAQGALIATSKTLILGGTTVAPIFTQTFDGTNVIMTGVATNGASLYISPNQNVSDTQAGSVFISAALGTGEAPALSGGVYIGTTKLFLPAGVLDPSGINNFGVGGYSTFVKYAEFQSQIIVGGSGNPTISPANDLALQGQAARSLGVERAFSPISIGQALTITAGGGRLSTTNSNGGNLTLKSGTGTGTGTGSVIIQATGGGSSGTTDRAAATVATFATTGISFVVPLTVTQSTLGNAVQTLVSVATNDDPTEILYQNRVATTDATQTTLHTFTVPSSTTYAIESTVVARRTGGASGTAEDGARYLISAVYKNVAGTATIIGAITTLLSDESQAGWDATFTTSGATVLLRVTGAVSNNVTWHMTSRVYLLST